MRKASNIFYWLLVAALFLIAVTFTVSELDLPGGVKFYTIQSGSMEPALHTGSIVAVKPQDTYQKGDIIPNLCNQVLRKLKR